MGIFGAIGMIIYYYVIWVFRLVRWIGIPLFCFGSLLGLGSAMSIALTTIVAIGLFYLYLKKVYDINPMNYFGNKSSPS